MNLDTLRYFIAVMEAGSFREAAESLHVAQSALSRQIQSLERSLGTQLLSRLPRGVEPTAAGRIFLRSAKDTLANLTLARDEISALQSLNRGEVQIASIEPFADQILPDLITSFQKSHPGIVFDVRVGNTRQVVELVREGIAEIGIGYNTPPDPAIHVLISLIQPMMAFVSPLHPLAARSSIGIGDLNKHPMVLAPARSPSRRVIDEAARRAGISLRVVVESDSVGLRLALARQPPMVAILAAISGRHALTDGSLIALSFHDHLLEESNLQIISLKGRTRSRAVIDFERRLYGAARKIYRTPPSSGSITSNKRR